MEKYKKGSRLTIITAGNIGAWVLFSYQCWWTTVDKLRFSVEGQLVRGQVAGLSDSRNGNLAILEDRHNTIASVVNGKPQPSFWSELQSTTDKVADHISVANKNFNRIVLLRGLSSVDVLSESCFDPTSLDEEVLDETKENMKDSINWSNYLDLHLDLDSILDEEVLECKEHPLESFHKMSGRFRENAWR